MIRVRSCRSRPLVRLGFVAAVAAAVAASAAAQDSKSVALAKELAQILDQQKLDSVAAKDPSAPDKFVAALYFPGTLLVVSAKYSVPPILTEKLAKKNYKEIYVELNSASVQESKVFIEDVGADGLKLKAADGYEGGTLRVAFDGEWKKQKISEEDYEKAFAQADEAYIKILGLLIAELKKTS